jgi:hypothetical protein
MVPMRVKKEVAALHEPLVRAEAIGDSNAQFPLTPALSLGERGSCGPSLDSGTGSWLQCASKKTWRLSMNLPSLTDCRQFPFSPSEGERAGVRGLFFRKFRD